MDPKKLDEQLKPIVKKDYSPDYTDIYEFDIEFGQATFPGNKKDPYINEEKYSDRPQSLMK